MRAVLFVCLAALLAETLAFGYSNYQLPKLTTKRERYYKVVGGTYRSTQCATKNQCEALNKVDPTWKFRPSQLTTFKPINDQVLVAYDLDDEGNAIFGAGSQSSNTGDGGIDQDTTTQAALYTGIVAAVSADVISPNITEGARVYFAQACTTRWNVATWTATYGAEKAAAMAGKLMYGVDLSDAEGWQFTRPGADTTFPFGGSPMNGGYSSNGFATDGNTDPSQQSYPGYAGTTRAGEGALLPGEDADTPPENPGQQSNYLLCPEAQILGTIKEVHYANLDSRRYLKPTSIHRGQHLPFIYNLNTVETYNNPSAAASSFN